MTELATTSVEANNEHTDATASSSLDTDESSIKVASILNRLRSPIPSELSRKRKVASNPPKGSKKGKGNVSCELLNVFIEGRVREFPGENICRNRGKPFCNACSEPISVKKSVIRQHIKSAKHESGKVRLARRRNENEALLKWWHNHASALPKWSATFKVALLIQSSSAAAERVFSLLSNTLTERQTRSMEDYIETSVMFQYNYR